MKSWQLTDQIIRPKQEPKHRPLQYETPCATRKNTDQDSDGITGRITDQHHLSTPQPLHRTTLPPPRRTNTPPTTPPTTRPSVSPSTAPQAHHSGTAPTKPPHWGTSGRDTRDTSETLRGQDTITTGTPRHRRNTKMKIDWEPTAPQSQIFRKLCSGHRDTARTPPEHTTGTPPGHQEESRPGHRPRTIADFPKTGA